MAGAGASTWGLTPQQGAGRRSRGGPLPQRLCPQGSLSVHGPVLPGEEGSSGAPHRSKPVQAPSPRQSVMKVTVPARSLAAPGLPYLQSLQSLGALGTWRAAGGALVGKKQHRLSWERTQRLWRSRAGKDGFPRHAGLCGDAGEPPLTAWFWLGTLLLPALPAPRYQITLVPVFQARAALALPAAAALQRPAEGTRQWQLSPRNRRCLPLLGCVLGGPGGKETISMHCLISALFYGRGECHTWEGGRQGTGWEVCARARVPAPNPGLGGFFLPAENANNWGDTHGFPWRAWGTPRAVGSRVALGKNNPRKGDSGVGRWQVPPSTRGGEG